MEQLRHLGVYGIAIKQNCLCCVVKGPYAGPYANRYDLPGGGLQSGETLVEALRRECLEELGMNIQIISSAQVHDMWVSEPLLQQEVHHIAICYHIECQQEGRKIIAPEVSDGENDVVSYVWIPLADLNEMNASPLVQFVAKQYKHGQWPIEATYFPNWQR